MELENCPKKCIETGSVHFWCIFFWAQKTYKVEIQLLVGYSERRGKIGYYAPDGRSA